MSKAFVHRDLPVRERYELNGDLIVKTMSTPGGDFRSSRWAAGPEDEPLRDRWLKSYLLAGKRERHAYTSKSVRTVELFCGPGGLALGFGEACQDLGTRLESEAVADTDAGAVSVFRANHGTKLDRRACALSATEIAEGSISLRGDRSAWKDEPYIIHEAWEPLVGKVDAVLAGPPCQGHSNLNNHSRRTDNRNKLYLTVPKVAIALGVDIVVIENVPAVVHDSSEVVAATRTLLRDAGYQVESGVVSAVRFGWPQTRQRFFMVARRSRRPLPIEEVQAAFDDGTRHDVMWAIDDLLKADMNDPLHVETELSEENRRRIDYLFDHDLFDLPLTERPECHQGGTTYNSVYGRLHPDRPAPTITTGFLTPGRGRYIHPVKRRTLTAREAARLQGFPDDYNFFPAPSSPPSRASLTKWIGDAVPMPLGYVAGISALGNGWTR